MTSVLRALIAAFTLPLLTSGCSAPNREVAARPVLAPNRETITGSPGPSRQTEVPKEAVRDLIAEAEAIADRARVAYETCTTYQVRITTARVTTREGVDAPEVRTVATNTIAFVRPGLLRVTGIEESNGVAGDVVWGADHVVGELMTAPTPDTDVGSWMAWQHWLYGPAGAGLNSMLGKTQHRFLIAEMRRVTGVQNVIRDGEGMTLVSGFGGLFPMSQSDPDVEVRAWYSRVTGTLRAVAIEDMAQQKLVDKNQSSHFAPPKPTSAWYVVEFHDEIIDAAIPEVRFAPPAEYSRVAASSLHTGPSLIKRLGEDALFPQGAAETKSRPTVLMTSFMIGSEFLPAMEYLHRSLGQHEVFVASTGPRSKPDWITHSLLPIWPGFRIVGGSSTDSVAPMFFIIDRDNKLRAAITGYQPVHMLMLKDWIERVERGEELFTAEEIADWTARSERRLAGRRMPIGG